MNNIEEKIWAYIDGSCSEEEALAINLLIEQDVNYQKIYDEIVTLNERLSSLELDEPSMAFTYNVLENIRNENAKQPLKTTINTAVIKGIAAFFLVTILALLILVVINIDWSTNTTNNYTLPKLNLLSDSVLKGCMFLDIMLGAFLADTFLRRKDTLKHI
ncbi:MAG: hypothetical protein ABI367_07680 [Mucilaginibacter sp.]